MVSSDKLPSIANMYVAYRGSLKFGVIEVLTANMKCRIIFCIIIIFAVFH